MHVLFGHKEVKHRKYVKHYYDDLQCGKHMTIVLHSAHNNGQLTFTVHIRLQNASVTEAELLCCTI